jgi:hypothetical protein
VQSFFWKISVQQNFKSIVATERQQISINSASVLCLNQMLQESDDLGEEDAEEYGSNQSCEEKSFTSPYFATTFCNNNSGSSNISGAATQHDRYLPPQHVRSLVNESSTLRFVQQQQQSAIRNTIHDTKHDKKRQRRSRKGLPNLDLGGDISRHQRKRYVHFLYNERDFPPGRVMKCVICNVTELGFENRKPAYAHVAARCCGGNNTEIWNRVPVCADCNGYTQDKHMFDFLAEQHRHRIVPIVELLFDVYESENYVAASRFRYLGGVVPDYVAFANDLYGSGNPLLPKRGYFSSPIVNQVLTRYIQVRERLRPLQIEIAALKADQRVFERCLLAHLDDDEERETMLRVRARETARLAEITPVCEEYERELQQTRRWNAIVPSFSQ